MERKTHRESWKGEESVKERFTLPEEKMVPYLEGEYTLEQAQSELKAKVQAPCPSAKVPSLGAIHRVQRLDDAQPGVGVHSKVGSVQPQTQGVAPAFM